MPLGAGAFPGRQAAPDAAFEARKRLRYLRGARFRQAGDFPRAQAATVAQHQHPAAVHALLGSDQ